MGTDINIYPEYYSEEEAAKHPDRGAYSVCSYYSIGRNRVLFNIMCKDSRTIGTPSLYPPRGLPTDPPPGWIVSEKYSLTVVEDKLLSDPTHYQHWRTISQTQADAVINKTVLVAADPTIPRREKILNPNYYAYSHLTTQELLTVRLMYLTEQVQNPQYYNLTISEAKKYKKILNVCTDPLELFNHNFGPFEYASLNGLIGMLYAIERSNVDYKGRIIFWFDS